MHQFYHLQTNIVKLANYHSPLNLALNNNNFIFFVVIVVVAVVIAFFICWAPFHAQRLLYVYAKDSPNYREINEKMFFVTGK